MQKKRVRFLLGTTALFMLMLYFFFGRSPTSVAVNEGIVYAKIVSSVGQLYFMNPLTLEDVQITDIYPRAWVFFRNPWSPGVYTGHPHQLRDPHTMGFISGLTSPYGLYVLNRATLRYDPIDLGRGIVDAYATVSPDQQLVATMRFEQRQLEVYTTAGVHVRCASCATGSPVIAFDWHPSSTTLVYSARIAETVRVVVVHLDGTQRDITPPLAAITDVRWSQGGDHIALTAADPATQRRAIYLMDANGQNVRPLVPLTARDADSNDSQPAWSPDDTSLVFTRINQTGRNIFTIRRDGTNLKQLTYDGQSEQPVWLPAVP